MKTVRQLHDEAMQLAQLALVARHTGEIDRAAELSRQAYNIETKAASLVPDEPSSEPTRSILYRSAASLALNCGEIREAERLSAIGLAGNPPDRIAAELRGLLKKIYFQMGSNTNNIVVAQNNRELFMSITGEAVDYGVARSEEVTGRLSSLQKLMLRTVERLLDRPYRTSGEADQVVRNYPIRLAVQPPGSFVISMSIGDLENDNKDENSLPRRVIDELITCFSMLNSSNDDDLFYRFHSSEYFKNFLDLSHELAPNGKEVEQISFSTPINIIQERSVNFTRRKDDISQAIRYWQSRERGTSITIRGILERTYPLRKEKGAIKITSSNGDSRRIIVLSKDFETIIGLLQETIEVQARYDAKGELVLESIQKIVTQGTLF
jgi:hypothetical protein